MSRSNKEMRMGHTGMDVSSGHGGMKRNKGAGALIRPQDTESSGMAKFKGRRQGGTGGGGTTTPNARPMDTEGKSGWQMIGEAGGEMAGEYMRRRKERQKTTTTSGR